MSNKISTSVNQKNKKHQLETTAELICLQESLQAQLERVPKAGDKQPKLEIYEKVIL